MNEQERQEGLELLAAATPGPWEAGDVFATAGVIYEDGTCAYCEQLAEPIWTGRLDINGTVMDAHVHRDGRYPDDHIITAAGPPFDTVAGNYDYEEGGIICPSDAALIVWLRNHAEDLLARPSVEAQQ